MFDSFVDPILRPLLGMNILVAIALVSFIMSIIITFAYKWLTDQSLMKDMKTEIKTLQKQMKELRSNPQKMMKVQKKAMETNMKYMMHSMKPTLITFIPIILIFGWLNGHIAFQPLLPDQQFSVAVEMDKGASGTIELSVPEEITLVSEATQDIANNQASWTMKGKEGVFILEFTHDEKVQEKEVTISTEQAYSEVESRVSGNGNSFRTITLSNEKTKPLGDISIFGWTPGWLAVYIILSIIFSMVLRKSLKIY